jgi:hypothetical protein
VQPPMAASEASEALAQPSPAVRLGMCACMCSACLQPPRTVRSALLASPRFASSSLCPCPCPCPGCAQSQPAPACMRPCAGGSSAFGAGTNGGSLFPALAKPTGDAKPAGEADAAEVGGVAARTPVPAMRSRHTLCGLGCRVHALKRMHRLTKPRESPRHGVCLAGWFGTASAAAPLFPARLAAWAAGW